MANTIWTGASSTNFGTAGNWTNGVPTSANPGIFGSANVGNCTTGMDQGALDIAGLIVHSGYTGQIGSSGDPLKLSTNLLWYEGAGGLYFASDANGIANKTDEVFIKAAHANVPVEIDSNSADAGQVDNIHIVRGNVTLAANITGIDRMTVGYVNNLLGDARVTLAASSTALTLLNMTGGQVQSDVPITNAVVDGGVLDHQEGQGITNAYVNANGRLLYGSTSTMSFAEIGGGGLIDLTQDGGAKTITTCVLTGNGRLKRFLDGNLHVVTNFRDMRENQ